MFITSSEPILSFIHCTKCNELLLLSFTSAILSVHHVYPRDGTIAWVGPDSEVGVKFPGVRWGRVVEAFGRAVVPGLVDGHTHPVWAGDRVHEFALKVRLWE